MALVLSAGLLGLGFCILILLSFGANDAGRRSLAHGPVLGHVTDRSARVWARTRSPGTVVCEALDAAGEVVSTATASTGREHDCTATLVLEGLSPETSYPYRIRVDGTVFADPAWTLRTWPAPGTPVRLRIGITSCFDDREFPEARGYAALASLEPDFVLALGDNAYIDSTKVAAHRLRYRSLRSVAPLAALACHVPTLAVWDDHNFGKNDSGGWLPGKGAFLSCFRDYWPNPPCPLGEGEGCCFAARVGDVGIWMLDGRWHRTAPGESGATMLGERQRAWLTESLASSAARVKLVAIGVPWCGRMKKPDSWAAYIEERDALFAEWARCRIPGIVLLSGDTHYCSAWRIDAPGMYPLHEINSSGIGREPRDLPRERDGLLRVAENRAECFWFLEIDTASPEPGIVGTVYGPDGQIACEPLSIPLSSLGFDAVGSPYRSPGWLGE
ncbi:MAG: alkaline phosphatase D family protein [Planctomycetes bacterium]|nr:alkaline phosphatase D family protein [Planctomycetota bacterium]